jgi:hypothetical protein
MAKRGGIKSVVENGLVRGRQFKNISENESCFSGRDA